MGYLQTDAAIEGCCQLPKPFLEEKIFSQNKKLSENIFGKLHRYYMVHFGLLLSCYSVHKGQSGSYVGFFLQFYLILHDFSFLVILDCILVEHIVMKQG